MSRLIDTTQTYLRTVLELEEEGVVAMRARIAERLNQSGPTVSQTVARMQRDGLLHMTGNRHLELTTEGRRIATRVMRKHRLAECLLVDVIGMEWEQVHADACRWEHVMSEDVERRLFALLRHPTQSPYGNPIPGLQELGDHRAVHLSPNDTTVSLKELQPEPNGTTAIVRRIGEPIQTDPQLMYTLRYAGVLPGAMVSVTPSPGGVLVGSDGKTAELPTRTAAHIFVTKP